MRSKQKMPSLAKKTIHKDFNCRNGSPKFSKCRNKEYSIYVDRASGWISVLKTTEIQDEKDGSKLLENLRTPTIDDEVNHMGKIQCFMLKEKLEFKR